MGKPICMNRSSFALFLYVSLLDPAFLPEELYRYGNLGLSQASISLYLYRLYLLLSYLNEDELVAEMGSQ